MWRCVVLVLILLVVAGCISYPAMRFQHPVTGVVAECAGMGWSPTIWDQREREVCIQTWLASGYVRIP
jgi:hypothetical protein